MLVGRQIVDRAKIQRIIFEFDYYEKAFHQFYDTYRVVPGNINEKICNKHTVFRNFDTNACTYDANFGSYSLVTKINNHKLNGSYNTLRPYAASMVELYLAGLIDKWDGYRKIYMENDEIPIALDDSNGYLNTYANMHALFPSSSYDKMIFISYNGWKKVEGNIYQWGMQRYLNYNTDNEIFNLEWYKNIDNHNTIMMKYLESSEWSGKYITSTTKKAAIDSKLTSELDAKIDDGRPGTGRFLAFKTVNEEKYCYDKVAAEAHKAIYNSDTNNKYGCNIIKVMEDVK